MECRDGGRGLQVGTMEGARALINEARAWCAGVYRGDTETRADVTE